MNRREFLSSGAVVAATVVMARASTRAAQAAGAPAQPASFGATGADFPKVCGDLANQNHSTLGTITRANIGRLGGAWHVNLEGGDTSQHQQSTIVAQDGVLYVQTTQQHLFAVDGKTGQIKWKANLGKKTTSMRGVGLGEGKVYSTSGDDIVYAFDLETGRQVWQRPLITPAEEGRPGHR